MMKLKSGVLKSEITVQEMKSHLIFYSHLEQFLSWTSGKGFMDVPLNVFWSLFLQEMDDVSSG